VSFVVTIDGPAAAGKSTTARAIAQRMGWRYLDTGAYYRALALKILQQNVQLTDREASALALATRIELSGDPARPHVLLDDADVTDAIRTPAVSEAASQVAALSGVRRILVDWQRSLREREPLVGEGRDLGTVVFPDAEVKLYLEADLETRAERRYAELLARGIAATRPVVMAELAARDHRDKSRPDSPLKSAHDAVVLDTSGMDVPQQVAAALAIICAHPGCPPALARPIE
jgi:cytidylate kinase